MRRAPAAVTGSDRLRRSPGHEGQPFFVLLAGGSHGPGFGVAAGRVEGGGRQLGGEHEECAVDLALVVEYGVGIAELADLVRLNVITGLEGMTGLEVVEVNIAVDDIHIGGNGGDDRRVE